MTSQQTTDPYIGSWKSFDENSGEETSIVEIFNNISTSLKNYLNQS
jgi:hypothetical protein